VAIWFTNIFQLPFNVIELHLPITMTAWAKVCIVGGGSKIQAYGAQHEGEYHDASFV